MAAHVVIVGGGFGGINAAKALAKQLVRVTLVDKRNHHLFQPLLYQVATAALSPGQIAAPIRSIFRRQSNVEVLLGEVIGFDLDRRQVITRDGAVDYDYLIVAAGARDNYFGHDRWAAEAPGLKSLEEALDARRRILGAYEAAERAALAARERGAEVDGDRVRELLTFVIVGGGPTGVELAGALAEIARHTLRDEFRAIDPSRTRILLIEGGPRLLAAYPDTLSAEARRRLERLGVEVRTGAIVTDIQDGTVRIGDEAIRAGTVLWAAGVAASTLGRALSAPLDRTGRVIVGPDLTVPGRPEVYVVGDLASFPNGLGRPLPGIAPVAIQQGRWAAANIARTIAGGPRKPFRYVDRGKMAIIGRGAGVADFGFLRLSGFPAWVTWLFVHILFLIGFENRLLVLTQWAWSYLTYQRGVRLITDQSGATYPYRSAAWEGVTKPSETSDAITPGSRSRGSP